DRVLDQRAVILLAPAQRILCASAVRHVRYDAGRAVDLAVRADTDLEARLHPAICVALRAPAPFVQIERVAALHQSYEARAHLTAVIGMQELPDESSDGVFDFV